MKAKWDEHKTLHDAFRAAFMLTGSIEVAETAVLDGIAASESIHAADEVLICESVKFAIQRRTSCSGQRAQAFAHLPVELRRLFLLAPFSRDCFVLRILVGIPSATCAAVPEKLFIYSCSKWREAVYDQIEGTLLRYPYHIQGEQYIFMNLIGAENRFDLAVADVGQSGPQVPRNDRLLKPVPGSPFGWSTKPKVS
jgi:hypothetical protein